LQQSQLQFQILAASLVVLDISTAVVKSAPLSENEFIIFSARCLKRLYVTSDGFIHRPTMA